MRITCLLLKNVRTLKSRTFINGILVRLFRNNQSVDLGKTIMFEETDKGRRQTLGSDVLLPAVNDIFQLYNALAIKRDLAFAQAVWKSATQSDLGYSTAKLTLEATLALAEQHPTNNHLEQLPEIVARVYALTPEKTKELRIKFIDELKSQAHLAIDAIRAKAETYYHPSQDEIREYVTSLPKEGKVLLLKSCEDSWETLKTHHPKYKEEIEHFLRLESQFGINLRDYLPAQ
jgi:hypothetical protein